MLQDNVARTEPYSVDILANNEFMLVGRDPIVAVEWRTQDKWEARHVKGAKIFDLSALTDALEPPKELGVAGMASATTLATYGITKTITLSFVSLVGLEPDMAQLFGKHSYGSGPCQLAIHRPFSACGVIKYDANLVYRDCIVHKTCGQQPDKILLPGARFAVETIGWWPEGKLS